MSDPAPLANIAALVTGASRGVGMAVARAYLEAGAHVVGTATTGGGCEGAIADFGHLAQRFTPVQLELADPESCQRAVAAALATLGRLDVVVNNAGLLGRRGPLVDQPPHEWDRVIDVNLNGPVRLLRLALPHLSDGGAIINVTSGAAGRPGWGAYSLSKLGLEGVTSMLRNECSARNIRCVAVNPGPARTQMRAAAYPSEDPCRVPRPSDLTAVFVAIAAGADPGQRVEAADWVQT